MDEVWLRLWGQILPAGAGEYLMAGMSLTYVRELYPVQIETTEDAQRLVVKMIAATINDASCWVQVCDLLHGMYAKRRNGSWDIDEVFAKHYRSVSNTPSFSYHDISRILQRTATNSGRVRQAPILEIQHFSMSLAQWLLCEDEDVRQSLGVTFGPYAKNFLDIITVETKSTLTPQLQAGVL